MESGTLRDLGRPVSPYISETQMESRETDMGEKSRHYFLLLLLFSASGCAALIYEIVWYQLLQLAIGSTAVSLGIVLATFMGGLCLGSIALPRMPPANRHPFALYAMLEAGIAACAILVLFGIPLVDRVYIAGAEHGLPG